jgi:hypothetical protein
MLQQHFSRLFPLNFLNEQRGSKELGTGQVDLQDGAVGERKKIKPNQTKSNLFFYFFLKQP